MAGTFDGRGFVLPAAAATMAVFFAAAKMLPPIETSAFSLAAAAGFTNRLYPLLSILLAGGFVVGALGLRREVILPLRIGVGAAPVPYWRWHVAAACALCVLQISVFQTWSQEASYFGARLALMDAGQRPYADFEFAYGYAVAYGPYALHALGLSIRHALVLALALAALVGVWSIAVIVRHWIADPRLRLLLFWGLIVSSALVRPGPSLNYNFARYALPFALLLVLTRHGPVFGAPGLFAATAAANLVAYFLSPEMGLAFAVGVTGWVAVGCRALPARPAVAALVASGSVLAGLIVFARPMFTTLLAFSEIQVLLPVVPHLIMVLALACFLIVCAAALPAAVAVWRGRSDGSATLTIAQACACAALAAALMPTVVGRSWPTTTIAYGFGTIVMAAGYLEAAGAKRAALAVAWVFVVFVAYCAQFVVRDDVRSMARILSDGCTPAVSVPCPPVKTGLAAALLTDARTLAARFPKAYDPLGAVGYHAPQAVELGYYPGVGQGNAITESAFARKRSESMRAPYYILPVQDAAWSLRLRRARALQAFAHASLLPVSFRFNADTRDIAVDFIEMLYARCRPLAVLENVKVCAAPGAPP
jgi:hypothetical protein